MRLSKLMTLAAALAMSAVATAAPTTAQTIDPACADRGPGVYDFALTTDPLTELVPGQVTGGGTACRTELRVGRQGRETQFVKASITTAPGVSYTSAADLEDRAYAGTFRINALTHDPIFGAPLFLANQDGVARIDNNLSSECPRGDKYVVACYRGQSLLGFGAIWISYDPNLGVNVLNIGEFRPLIGSELIGLSRIVNLSLCPYAGAVGSHGTAGSCGDTVPLASNGFAVPEDERQQCIDAGYTPSGLGTFSVIARQRGGLWVGNPDYPPSTDPAEVVPSTACVPWVPAE